jgi:hypothetical protein
MCLASLATTACCCAGAVCCECMCIPFKMFGVAAKNFSKIGYVAFQIVWLLITLLVITVGSWFTSWSTTIGI